MSPAVIRVDPALGFMAFRNDETLKSLRLSLEIASRIRIRTPLSRSYPRTRGRTLKQEPTGGPVSQFGLIIAVARLNSRIRYSGLSARELWTQRSQFTHEQLPISDRENIR